MGVRSAARSAPFLGQNWLNVRNVKIARQRGFPCIGIMTTNFSSESARNRRGGLLDGGYCDITSFRLQRRGPYDFTLSIQGSFVPPASHMMNSTPIEQPRAGGCDVAFIDLDGNSLFGESDGLGNIFPNGAHRISSEVQVPVVASSWNNGQNGAHESIQDTALDANFDFDLNNLPRSSINPLDIAGEHQKGHCEIAVSDSVLNGFQDNLDDIIGMSLPGQGIDWPDSLETRQTASALGSKMHLSDEFNEDNGKGIFDIGVRGLEIDPETKPNAPSVSQDVSFFPFRLDQNTLNDILSIDIPSFETVLPDSLEMSPNPPSSQAMSFSSNSDASDFSTHLSTPTRHSPAATPSSAGSPGRNHFCNHCNKAFERSSDLNRHAKVHFSGQRIFPCTHLGCRRKEAKAFYRKDKLKDHEKQVHGFVSSSSL
ncbi:hypothetical protein EG329_003167 [Mollisiaceae sp. DMI_Dod_QoI]|nr:hypothetical protein EG329_003167 [Helotiales sp. DMI_Dod_QoI]